MKVVFCTTCKGRTQHLARTLPRNLADNSEGVFVVLSYNDTGDLESYLKANHQAHIDSGRLVVYQYKEPVPFRMAHAKNMAHRLGILEGGDILVNIDADNFTGPGFDKYVAERLASQPNAFLWSRMIKEGDGRLPRGISGRIAVTRADFFRAGGYDEKYHTYAPDDKDFNARLRRLGLDGLEIDPRFLQAILHNDKMRFREYPHAAASTCDDFQLHEGPAVVNGGVIGCGSVYKNFGSEPIYVRPVTCKVFGIGMHKTATTSLHRAMTILGYRSAHWPSAHWAKAVWREMNQTGTSPTLDKYDAACDLPIPQLFQKLDAAYPGSKFILTVREESSWLESARKHWSPEHNKFRAQWDNDPFSNRIHQIIYGRTDFEPTRFLERYRNHNARVLEHFQDRSDLLVMNMDSGSGWHDLCAFLGVAVPSVPYPSGSSTK